MKISHELRAEAREQQQRERDQGMQQMSERFRAAGELYVPTAAPQD